MINRDNYHTVKEFLEYQRTEKQLNDKTIDGNFAYLKHLLSFMDSRPLYDMPAAVPTFPDYLRKVESRIGAPLNPTTRRAILNRTSSLLRWAKSEKRGAYLKMRDSWIDNLKISRTDYAEMKDKDEHQFFTLDEVMKVAEFRPSNDDEERTRAALVFLFLSGMRISAFCSLPVSCVDIADRRIDQRISKGVVTKFGKSATTFLLDIPELLAVVSAWDTKVREIGSKYWYMNIDKNGIAYPEDVRNLENTVGVARSALKRFCRELGLRELSPHKLRHGHAMYGMKHARNIEELKAVSQNLMHSNIGITDGIYGTLNNADAKEALSFGKRTADSDQNAPDIIALLTELLAKEKGKKLTKAGRM